MTIQPTIPPSGVSTMPPGQPQTVALVAASAVNQADRTLLASATLTAVLAAWAQVEMARIIPSWFASGLGSRVFALLSIAQESTASRADAFVQEAYRLQGRPIERPMLLPSTFAGIASDGRSLESLLAGAPAIALQRVRRGEGPAVASAAGQEFLRRVVTTQVADAGRAADSVAIATAVPAQRQPGPAVRTGWVRMLNPPSCARCVVLAGRFYRWNEGFPRHPMCDCSHIPATEDVAGDVVTDPDAYFASLTRSQQDDAFGRANAAAIRDGADMNQVVNATTRGGVRTADDGHRYTLVGTTRRGTFGRTRRGQPPVLRPTPWQIYRDARGDQEEARRLLRQFRYIIR